MRRSPRLPFRPLRAGEWWDATSENQVDVAAIGARGELLVGECKWGRVTGDHLRTLRQRAQVLAAEIPRTTRVHTVLFSARGEADDEVRRESASGAVLLFSAEDLRENSLNGSED